MIFCILSFPHYLFTFIFEDKAHTYKYLHSQRVNKFVEMLGQTGIENTFDGASVAQTDQKNQSLLQSVLSCDLCVQSMGIN